ncbi:hypothetical protein EDB86DRAFT_2918520, partial [Lactarius hatsudake]
LAAQPAGQLRRNAGHVSGTLATKEKAGANLDVMKRGRVRLRDHRGKALGTMRLRCRASSLSRLRFGRVLCHLVQMGPWELAIGVVVDQLNFPVMECVCRRFHRLTNARHLVAKCRHLAMTCSVVGAYYLAEQ